MKKPAIGIVVGRFHADELHEGHLELLKSVCDKHPRVFVFLGLSPLLATKKNPLDFEARKQMILEKFPNVNVLYIKDVRDNEVWVKKLESQIEDISGVQEVMLYGGRESFIDPYIKAGGKFPTTELESTRYVSATEIRERISRVVKNSREFRQGVIWATYNRYPTVFTTVDVVIYDENRRLLMVRKPGEKLYRFVGGFSNVTSPSFEYDAKREVQEETGVAIGEPEYMGSFLVKDWRYEHEDDKIKTLVFAAKYLFGAPKGMDDVAEARWFNAPDLSMSDIVEEHHPIYTMWLKRKV